jgi:hypothetical protein
VVNPAFVHRSCDPDDLSRAPHRRIAGETNMKPTHEAASRVVPGEAVDECGGAQPDPTRRIADHGVPALDDHPALLRAMPPRTTT